MFVISRHKLYTINDLNTASVFITLDLFMIRWKYDQLTPLKTAIDFIVCQAKVALPINPKFKNKDIVEYEIWIILNFPIMCNVIS